MPKSTRMIAALLALTSTWLWSTGSAQACSCEAISPAEGFARAHYVFVGKVVEAGTHTWRVEVDRVWKGKETLPRTARLMDVYAMMDCAFFFKEGERYLFFAIVASIPFWLHAGSKLALLHPRVRRAFLFERDEPIRLQRIGTIVMMSLYGAALLIGIVCYVVR